MYDLYDWPQHSHTWMIEEKWSLFENNMEEIDNNSDDQDLNGDKNVHNPLTGKYIRFNL